MFQKEKMKNRVINTLALPSLYTLPRCLSFLGNLLVIKLVIFFFLRSSLVAYGGFQARGRIRAVAYGLHHTHSNVASEPYL